MAHTTTIDGRTYFLSACTCGATPHSPSCEYLNSCDDAANDHEEWLATKMEAACDTLLHDLRAAMRHAVINFRAAHVQGRKLTASERATFAQCMHDSLVDFNKDNASSNEVDNTIGIACRTNGFAKLVEATCARLGVVSHGDGVNWSRTHVAGKASAVIVNIKRGDNPWQLWIDNGSGDYTLEGERASQGGILERLEAYDSEPADDFDATYKS